MPYKLANKILTLLALMCVTLTLNARPISDSGQKVSITPLPESPSGKITRSFPGLESFIDQSTFSYTNVSGYNADFFEDFNQKTSGNIDQLRGLAKTTIAEVESSNNYVDYLEPSDLNKLPIGLKKKVGNTEVTVAVSSVVFTAKYAELTVFARIKIPQSPNQIFFGVQGIKLSHKGGIIGDAKLVLLGDVAIPINGNNGALILKGGMDLNTGLGNDLTYVKIDCNGFKELQLSADVQFPRSLLIPCNDAGDPLPTGLVGGRITTAVKNWNDILVYNLNLPKFQIAGLNGIAFSLSELAFDFSDYNNASSVYFPDSYQEKYLVPGNTALWRGVYSKKIDIILPKAFKDRTTSERIRFGVQDLLIDNNGITGIFYGENLLPIDKGSASGWKFSVDSIRLALEANHLTRAGFGGKIGLPITKIETNGNTRNKLLEYSAIITPGSGYLCRVITKDSLDFDLWKARVILQPNSYIQLAGNEDGLKPEAMLNGTMGIVARSMGTNPDRDASKNPVADFKGIEFQALHLTTNPPYVTAQYFGYRGEVKVGNFPVSLSDIALVSNSNTEAELKFKLDLNFHDNDITASTHLRLVGKMDSEGGLQSWKYDHLGIDAVHLDANVKETFRLTGDLLFMDNDPTYGDGFMGRVNAHFEKGLDGLDVQARAIFGKKEFRYWLVDGSIAFPGSGAPVFAGINIKGFAGGASYRMKKSFDQATEFSGATFTPDETAGLGVTAGVLFNWGTNKVANGKVSFEIAFNRGGGVRYVGLFGMVRIMEDIFPEGADVKDFVKDQYKDIVQTADRLNNLVDSNTLNQMKIFQPAKAAENALTIQPGQKPGDQGISAYLGIQYDFAAKTLHGNFDLYIQAAGALLRGVGSNNRAGWAVLHFAPKEWYVHMGTPTDRLGVRFGIGGFSISTGTYFMVGHKIPDFPKPPKPVLDYFQSKSLSYDNQIQNSELSEGKGFAFGANVSVNTGDIRFLMLYANLQAGIGFDVMIKDMKGKTCAGSSGPVGINGWYAEGQAYAYLQGELGVRIKLGPIKKNISILKAGAAALLQAKLPNPTWVGGYFGVRVEILGGRISSNFDMKLSFGKTCEFVQDTGALDYDDFVVVSSIAPANQATNVSVLGNAKVRFDIKPNTTLDIDSKDGAGYIYPKLEYAKIVEKTSNGDIEIPVKSEYINDGVELVLTPESMLKGSTNYKVMTKVVFMEYKYGNWAPISENGQRVEELKEQLFTTGNMPDTILPEIITKMYPFFEQRNVYKNETNIGYLNFNTEISNLLNIYQGLPGFQSWVVRFKNANGQVQSTTYANYETGNKRFVYTLPNDLLTNTTYKAELVGSITTNDPIKPILKFQFTTSTYNTLSQKVQALQAVQPIVGRVSSDIINLQAKVGNYEGFELYELRGNKYTENKPLVSAEAIMDDAYFTQSIKLLLYSAVDANGYGPALYDSYPYPGQGFYVTRDTWEMGLPPTKAITLSSYYISALSSSGGMYNDYLKTRIPFVYDLVRYYNIDFIDLRAKVINHYMTPTSTTTYTCYGNSDPYGYSNLERYQDPYAPDAPAQQMDFIDGGSYCVPQTEMVVQQVPIQFHPLVLNPFPFMSRGDYKIRIQYKLPNGVIGSVGEFKFHNPIY